QPLVFINMSSWDNEPVPEQDWSVLNRIPRQQCVLFSGEGAAGKSTEQLHLSAAHVLGRDWLGTMPAQGPALFIDAEDGEKVIHRRLAAITAHYGVTFNDLIKGGLHLISCFGQDAVLATASRNGKIEPTALYQQILEAVGDIKPVMIGIASSANVYTGSEIDRSQVQQFVGLMTHLPIVANGSVVLISHPSLTGVTTESGISGSTQWHNAVRARFYMKGVKPKGVKPEEGDEPDTDLREIVFEKNNYGPVSDSITLRYQNGLFLPVAGATSFERAAREAKAAAMFLDQLGKDEMNLSMNSHSGNYAPRVLARMLNTKNQGVTEKDLGEAMQRLYAAGKIRVENYGRRSDPRYRLVVNDGRGE